MRRKQNFTLIELIAAMGVFVIILAMVMQIFTGAQTMWRHTENRTEIYADARAAMDIVCRMIENSAALYQETPDAANEADKTWIPVYSPDGAKLNLATTFDGIQLQNDATSNLYYLQIYRNSRYSSADDPGDTLHIKALSNASAADWSQAPEPNLYTDDYPPGTANDNIVIPRVVGLRFTTLKKDGSQLKALQSDDTNIMPMAVVVEMVVLERNVYKKLQQLNPNKAFGSWSVFAGEAADKKELLAKYGKKFTRIVYLENNR